jgi:hypothetical protein
VSADFKSFSLLEACGFTVVRLKVTGPYIGTESSSCRVLVGFSRFAATLWAILSQCRVARQWRRMSTTVFGGFLYVAGITYRIASIDRPESGHDFRVMHVQIGEVSPSGSLAGRSAALCFGSLELGVETALGPTVPT